MIFPTLLPEISAQSGVNFINVLRKAFARMESKSVKKTVKLSIFLRFWDLRVQKLYENMLVKLTPGLSYKKFRRLFRRSVSAFNYDK